MYDKNSSSRTVGEAFGVSKDQIQKLVTRKAEVLEKYSGNAPIYSASWQYSIPGAHYGHTGYECHINNEFVTEAKQLR